MSDKTLIHTPRDANPSTADRLSEVIAPPAIDGVRGQLRVTDAESTRAMVAAVDARDPYTREHSLNVAAYAEVLAVRLGRSRSESAAVRQAALLHDIGKIGIPDAILTKPGPLTELEFESIRRHPEIAVEILAHISDLTGHLPLILHHHERYDGRGYPAGLRAARIPLGARILAVADALDTMFSPRAYKPAYTLEQVRAELIAGAARHFDPRIVAVALAWLDEPSANWPRNPDPQYLI